MNNNLKIILIGQSAVGKSQLILRYTKGIFDETQQSTIGLTYE